MSRKSRTSVGNQPEGRSGIVAVSAAVVRGGLRGSLALLCALAVTLGFAARASAAPTVTTTQLLVNGSFETGDFTGWTPTAGPSSCTPWQVYTSPASPCFAGLGGSPPTISAVDGNDFASVTWDGVAGADPELTQVVTIPANSTDTLAWSDNTSWDLFGGSPRVESVDILSGSTVLASTTIFTINPGQGTTGWVSHALDLSAYGGQTVGVRFHLTVPQNFTGPAIYSLDGVTLNSTPNLPTSKDQCKDGGWQNYGSTFKNQGDCVSFVNNGK